MKSPRSYVVGLPVIVTVHPDGFVHVTVDTAEMASALREEHSRLSDVTDERVEADADVVREWLNVHGVMNEGYAK